MIEQIFVHIFVPFYNVIIIFTIIHVTIAIHANEHF